MEQLIGSKSYEQSAGYRHNAGWPKLSAADFERTSPDIHWQVIADDGSVQARCSLWWQGVPAYVDQKLGLIGHYAADNDAAAAIVLRQALAHLRAQGCTFAAGPIDGSTWESYRFVTQRSPEAPFFLEPDQPDAWPEHFRAQGFAALANYTSALCTNLTHRLASVARVRERLCRLGISLRQLNQADPIADLQAIYRLSTTSFRHNFLQGPISEAAFVQKYQALLPYIDPALVVLAEHADQLVGFVFSVPNQLQTQRGQPLDTLIIKTVAIDPEAQYRGLGAVLIEELQLTAHRCGYQRAIHALMHETNRSSYLSQRYDASIIRCYKLFGRYL
jgi:predicted N-acetyltransferase YhbS